MRKPNGYWTYERCLEEAKKCKSRSEFEKRFSGAAKVCRKNNWMDEICSHMENKKKPNGYWTKEICHELALLCESRSEFSLRYRSAYNSALKNGWLEEICSHMEYLHMPNGYWENLENRKKAALSCKNRTEFFKKYSRAAVLSLEDGTLDDLCSHMTIRGNRKKRCVYVYIFEDNHFYVGLSYNAYNRENQHLSDKTSAVNKHIKICPNYELIQLTEFVDIEIIGELERFYINKYEEKGFIRLNKARGGAVGGNVIKWTEENIWKTVAKCETLKEFREEYPGARSAANKLGIYGKIKKSLKPMRAPEGHYTFEQCEIYSKNCKSRSEFSKKYATAYEVCRINGWLDIFYPATGHKKIGYWTFERCLEECKKYKNQEQMRKASPGCYSAIRRNKWNHLMVYKNK